MGGLVGFFNRFNVNIRLERLVCHQEYDASGHSVPYVWPVFFRADASTFPNLASPVDIQIPFESQTGRGLFGEAGKEVRPGDVVPILESLGRLNTSGHSYSIDTDGDGVEEELLLVGFGLVLLEEDSTPSGAIRAGHQMYGASPSGGNQHLCDNEPTASELSPLSILN